MPQLAQAIAPMYRPPSTSPSPPIFDVPELPTLRRVKPLPKRRRTSSGSDPVSVSVSLSHDDPGLTASNTTTSNLTDPADPPDQDGSGGVERARNGNGNGTGGEAQVQVHDPTLAAQMALQAYYMPVLGGVRDLFKNAAGSVTTAAADGGSEQQQQPSRTSTPISIDLSAALAGFGTGVSLLGYGGEGVGGGVGTGMGMGMGMGMGRGAGVGGNGEEDEDGADGDYVDHLQQPGNTKKRKVPANMSGSAHGHDAGDGGSGAEDDTLESRGIPTGRDRDREGDDDSGARVSALGGAGGGTGGGGGGVLLAQGRNGYAYGYAYSGTGGKKGRLSRATLAGLQHKEVLKSRKRQLSAVLGALAQGNTLALDQALSASHLFMQAGVDAHGGVPPRVRLSRRRIPRLARALKVCLQSHGPADGEEGGENGDDDIEATVPPTSDFTFEYHSATSDRLVATKEEVAILHSRFEAELARQAAKAAEAAKQAASVNGPLVKRTNGAKQAARAASGKNAEQKDALEQSLLGTKGKGGKKKKRSALANASNPHHLRNYVPSRLPHSGPPNAQQAVQNAQNLLTPLPLRFLSAEIPPRRRKKSSEPTVSPVSTLTNPTDEWICPFCEYQLFYGDEQAYHRAVRNRKKILRRRRRARERAAAAASGVAPANANAAAGNDDVHPGFETPASVASAPVAKDMNVAAGGKQAKWKEGDRGGHGVATHA